MLVNAAHGPALAHFVVSALVLEDVRVVSGYTPSRIALTSPSTAALVVAVPGRLYSAVLSSSAKPSIPGELRPSLAQQRRSVRTALLFGLCIPRVRV